MTSKFKCIPVLDGNGDELTLYEIREPRTLFGLVPRIRFELCSGEAVEKCADGFVVLTTRERLMRVR